MTIREQLEEKVLRSRRHCQLHEILLPLQLLQLGLFDQASLDIDLDYAA